ncbi:MAG: oxygenase MpaB family protein, partial [Gemmatimonadaceae bacterium]
MQNPASQTTRWSDDAFLDTLRQAVDVPADKCVAALQGQDDFARLFAMAAVNNDKIPEDVPQALRDFFADTDLLIQLESDRAQFPDGLDHGRLRRGEKIFLDHAFAFCLVLLAKSLPEGYAAPNLSVLLNMSGNLRTRPYRRLLGVLQLVVDVSSIGGFDSNGRALAAARQARLMHAGIRRIVPRQMPDYAAKYGGEAVNLEDMLGTIMGLSLLVVDGLPKFYDALDDQDAEDYYYLWRAFAVAMGIHPPDQNGTATWVPANISEAREFYASYERRHYLHDPALNPDGVALARENLVMMQAMIPKPLNAIGGSKLPLIFMKQLIGTDGCRRIGLIPLDAKAEGHPLLMMTLGVILRFFHRLDLLDPFGRFHPTLARLLLQDMITRQYGGIVTFRIPQSLKQVQALLDRDVPAGTS